MCYCCSCNSCSIEALTFLMSVRSIDEPIVKETEHKVKQLIQELHDNKHIDDMAKKWLFQTPSPPRIQFSRPEEF